MGGHYLSSIFIERLWYSLKEVVYIDEIIN